MNVDFQEEFDEQFYLQQNPDVAAAVARGGWKSGYDHWRQIGRGRGRLGAPKKSHLLKTTEPPEKSEVPIFDAEWYERSYPLASEEIRNGKAYSCDEHYKLIGKHRGYLPNPSAPRPRNSAQFSSAFGGVWTSQANARDVVAGRRDIGLIDDNQADLLNRWIADGYVILPGAIPEMLLDASELELDRIYSGKIPEIEFNVAGVERKTRWRPETRLKPAKALDVHWFSHVLRNLIFSHSILKFLNLVFERRSFATQTLGFWRGSAQDAHQDSAYVNYSHPMQFLAS